MPITILPSAMKVRLLACSAPAVERSSPRSISQALISVENCGAGELERHGDENREDQDHHAEVGPSASRLP